jgi:hypothetical protein
MLIARTDQCKKLRATASCARFTNSLHFKKHYRPAIIFLKLPLLTLLLPLLSFPCYSKDNVTPSINLQVQSNKASVKSQKKIDKLADDTSGLAAEYRAVLRQIDSLTSYNRQIEKLVSSQRQEIDSLNAQSQSIEITQREILPFILRMLDTLEKFVSLDIPFLPDERRQRLASLRSLMDRADISIAEKYRRVMESYQIETEYGRTIESYQGALNDSDNPRTVQFLRIGRIALLYMTLDGNEVGHWNQLTKKFEPLDKRYRHAVAQGIRIAQKQAAPELLTVPVFSPEQKQ